MIGQRPRIAVVDHGAGNLVSIHQALTAVGADVAVVTRGADLRAIDGIVLPGVGAAGPAMERLASAGLVEPIRRWVGDDRPFLGICLGLQLLFDGSEEDGTRTLGIVPGRTVKLDGAPTLPHIGWNQVERRRPHRLFDGIPGAADFYFVHSYVGRPESSNPGLVLASTEHGGTFASAIADRSLLGVQFHPERSGPDGLRLLSNFVDLARVA
jgi:imidazole glycerol phosphate synthase glutamine amidotransferase subunit